MGKRLETIMKKRHVIARTFLKGDKPLAGRVRSSISHQYLVFWASRGQDFSDLVYVTLRLFSSCEATDATRTHAHWRDYHVLSNQTLFFIVLSQCRRPVEATRLPRGAVSSGECVKSEAPIEPLGYKVPLQGVQSASY